jgi:acyl-CoA thioester hydrolase
MFVHHTEIRVRYAETDQMNYVYYGNYATYFEIGRVEALRELGMTYKSLEDSGVMMPVLELKCKYVRPAYYDQLLRITTTISQIPETRIKFEYEVHNEKQELIHIGETVLVFVNMKTGRPQQAPVSMIERLKPFFKE